MLLDRLLAHVDLRVEPFAICDVRTGSHLELPAENRAQMHFVLDGRGVVETRQGNLPLGPYTLVLVPPNLAHTVRSGDSPVTYRGAEVAMPGVQRVVTGEGPTGLVLACGALRAEIGSAGLFERMPNAVAQAFSDSERVRALFESLFDEQGSPRPGQLRMIEAVMMQCLVHLLRRLLEAPGELPWLRALDDARLGPVLDAVLARPADPHTLDGLAQVAGMSRSSFSEHFHDAFGQSPMAFVKEVRLQLGARLLRTTDLPIKAIASKVGYASRSHFSRAFREQFERDPAHFRSEMDDD